MTQNLVTTLAGGGGIVAVVVAFLHWAKSRPAWGLIIYVGKARFDLHFTKDTPDARSPAKP